MRLITNYIITIAFISFWIYAAVDDLYHYGVISIGMQSQEIPKCIKLLLPWVLPFFEILSAILLVLDITRKFGWWMSTVLAFLFTSYVIYILTLPEDLQPSSYGNRIGQLSWTTLLKFNSLLLFLGSIGILLNRRQKIPPQAENLQYITKVAIRQRAMPNTLRNE